MEKWKQKLQDRIFEKYGGLLKDLGNASASEELRSILRKLVKRADKSYQAIIRNVLFAKLYKFVLNETQFLPFDAKVSARCWYVVNNRKDVIRCHNCGKELHRNINVKSKARFFWCCSKCQSEDKYMSRKISKGWLASKRRSTSRSELPPERSIVYRETPIVYDDALNARLYEYFQAHKKTFWHWIDKDPELKSYLMEKSYPLDYTDLKVETRVKWVLDKMQELPRCKACGRQIDFVDVKLSHEWREYCCDECKKERMSRFKCDWHARDIYGRMCRSTWTKPLFSLDEFKAIDRKSGEFMVECLKCGGTFELPFDLNFYNRNRKKSYFRCPVCFPIIGKRKMSEEELRLFRYVKNDLDIRSVKRGERKTIYPYELDIHPMKEHSDFAIEYNGIFWHSLEKGNLKDHILNKVKMCEEAGIRLLMVWEDDYLTRQDKIKQLIRDMIFNPAGVIANITCNGTADRFEVDRMVFNKCWEFPGYELVGETEIEEVFRIRPGAKRHWTTPTAGKLIYAKKQISDE